MPLEQAELAHAPEVFQLLARCRDHLQTRGIAQWDEYYPTLSVIEADARAGSLFVLRENARCVATLGLDDVQPAIYASVPWRHSTDRALVVHRLGVDPLCQGRGLARIAMAAVEAHAQIHGFSYIRLDTYTGNPAAMALFTTLGYEFAGEVCFPRRPLPFACFEKLLRQ